MSGGAAWRRKMIAGLLAGTAAPAEGEEEDMRSRTRRLARIAWSLARMDDLERAQKAADAAWMKLVEPYADRDDDEELPDLDPPPEQAALEAILGEIHAVTEQDRWPKHLHWTDV